MTVKHVIVCWGVALWLSCSASAAWAQDEIDALWQEEIAASQSSAAEAVPPPPVVAALDEEDEGYRIGVRDLLEIDVFRVPELSRKVRVDARGRITLPLVGTLPAAGKTPEELGAAIAERLAQRYVNDPYVTVFVVEYESQRVTVEGAVNRPGIFPLKGRTSLLQVIAQAEGLTDLADADGVQLFRTLADGRKVSYRFDVAAIRKGEAPDPLVQADDVIVVPRSGPKSLVRSVTNTLRGFISFGTYRP